eukprot:jgi/Chlat1/3041/Chrsp208S00235
MLLLFETPAGFALFKVLNEGKVSASADLAADFEDPDKAAKLVKLKAMEVFKDTAEALTAAAALVESKLPKNLRKFLKKHASDDTLALADPKLGNLVKEKLGIQCVHSAGVMELMRGVRSQLESLLSGLLGGGTANMALGLSHSLSRYKLKFSSDKVDTMVVQAIGLLDDLDKELNTYAMRTREWYGWHFPELGKIVADNIQYAKAVRLMRTRDRAADVDFSESGLAEEVEAQLKEAAQVSMGTEVSEEDMLSILALCEQVISLSEYRTQLYDYLKSRMAAIAPNLTVLVGELVGARLIAHAGSLLSLAKQPASTVQILGAEKALFRALKTKHETPKYGLIYHASLIGQSAPKLKGKISRVLAAKCALSIRVDALGDAPDASVGIENRAKVEARLRQLEGRALPKPAAGNIVVTKPTTPQVKLEAAPKAYNPATDATVGTDPAADKVKKEKKDKKKKAKQVEEPAEVKEEEEEEEEAAEEPLKKKKKKKQAEEEPAAVSEEEPAKKKKKARYFEEDGVAAEENGAAVKSKKQKVANNGAEAAPEKKRKKKDKQ